VKASSRRLNGQRLSQCAQFDKPASVRGLRRARFPNEAGWLAGFRRSKETNLACGPLWFRRGILPLRTGVPEENCVPDGALLQRFLKPLRDPFLEFRQRCWLHFPRKMFEVIAFELDADETARVKKMFGVPVSQLGRNGEGARTVVTRDHGHPDKINCDVRRAGGFDKFFLHRTGAVDATTSSG